MIGIKEHELCLHVKHYLGKPPSLPIPKSACAKCVEEKIKETERKKQIEHAEALGDLKKTILKAEYRKRYRQKNPYENSLGYARDQLMNAEWKTGDRKEIPKEVVELKLLMLQLKRIAKKQKGIKPRTWSPERRKKFYERYYQQRYFSGKSGGNSTK